MGPGPDLATKAVIKGTATFVRNIYADRYLENESSLWLERYDESSDPVRRYSVVPYLIGEQYISARFDSPANVSTVYTFSPKTTEAVLHQYPHRTEGPVPLRIPANGSEWTATDEPERVGELATRIVLGTALNDSAAAAGADGWGNDRLLRFRNGAKHGYAWALRWDDGENATEFVDAIQTYLRARASRTDGLWRTGNGTAFRIVSSSERTTVILYGNPTFVETTAVNGTVDVTVNTP